ncbi:MAG: divergent PAP2 family protein [Spirochaetaceae bacterium]|nr:MAG: divergent PAP2 family protein [Spirochaetaceae bacterium]
MQPGTTADLYRLLLSPVFLSASFSWLIAQLLKAIIEAFRNRMRGSRDFAETLLWKTGGMPSSHSSLVTALATSIGFRYGLSDPMFVLALFYGILIIRDALGVRRAAGLQAQALNRLGIELQRRQEVEFTLVKEVHGHTPSEVSVGVLLGFFIAVAFSML